MSHRRRWLLGIGVAALLVCSAVALVATASEPITYEPSDDANFFVYTYDGPESDQRQPGATDRSYWTESILDELPEDEDIYLLKSVTYRPLASNCGPGDNDEFGIDRGGTNEGEREVDDDLEGSVKSFSQDGDARDQYESEFDDPERLSTADGVTMERLEIDWYSRDDFGGTPVRLERGDRFVSAQGGCLDNPDEPGWYRWASYNEAELENGTRVVQESPAYSDWYWICDCDDREDAVETLGPPPGEEPEETPTPTEADAEESDDETNESDAETTPTPEGPAGESDADESSTTATPTPTPTATPEPTAEPTPTPSWDEQVVQTPTEGAGPGFTGTAALVALLLGGLAVRRR